LLIVKNILERALPESYPYKEVVSNTGYVIGLNHDLGKSTQVIPRPPL